MWCLILILILLFFIFCRNSAESFVDLTNFKYNNCIQQLQNYYGAGNKSSDVSACGVAGTSAVLSIGDDIDKISTAQLNQLFGRSFYDPKYQAAADISGYNEKNNRLSYMNNLTTKSANLNQSIYFDSYGFDRATCNPYKCFELNSDPSNPQCYGYGINTAVDVKGGTPYCVYAVKDANTALDINSSSGASCQYSYNAATNQYTAANCSLSGNNLDATKLGWIPGNRSITAGDINKNAGIIKMYQPSIASYLKFIEAFDPTMLHACQNHTDKCLAVFYDSAKNLVGYYMTDTNYSAFVPSGTSLTEATANYAADANIMVPTSDKYTSTYTSYSFLNSKAAVTGHIYTKSPEHSPTELNVVTPITPVVADTFQNPCKKICDNKPYCNSYSLLYRNAEKTGYPIANSCMIVSNENSWAGDASCNKSMYSNVKNTGAQYYDLPANFDESKITSACIKPISNSDYYDLINHYCPNTIIDCKNNSNQCRGVYIDSDDNKNINCAIVSTVNGAFDSQGYTSKNFQTKTNSFNILNLNVNPAAVVTIPINSGIDVAVKPSTVPL